MDVLREIREAEAHAERIEGEYRAKGDALLASVPSEINRERARREEVFAAEIRDLHAHSARETENARKTVQVEAAAETAAVEESAKANAAKAVGILIKALDI